MVIRSCDTHLVLAPTLVAVACNSMHAGDIRYWLRVQNKHDAEERMKLYMLNISSSYLARLQEMFNNHSVLIYIHMFISAYSLSLNPAFLYFLKRLLKLTDHNCFTLLHRIKSCGLYSGKSYINFHS